MEDTEIELGFKEEDKMEADVPELLNEDDIQEALVLVAKLESSDPSVKEETMECLDVPELVDKEQLENSSALFKVNQIVKEEAMDQVSEHVSKGDTHQVFIKEELLDSEACELVSEKDIREESSTSYSPDQTQVKNEALTDLKVEPGDTDVQEPELKTEEINIKADYSGDEGTVEYSSSTRTADISEYLRSRQCKYTCEICSYTTRHVRSIKLHSLSHKHPSELEMHTCDICSFESKYKSSLDRHMLKHRNAPKDAPKPKQHACEICPFVTKYRRSLKTHYLTHKDPSQLQLFECETCSLKFRRRFNLKLHSLTHKSPSELDLYKCDLCSYQTKFKAYLHKHLVRHKDPSELKMYECDTCPFRSKHRGNLISHIRKHKRLSGLE